MKKINLKEILLREDIKISIKENMFFSDQEVNLAIEKTLNDEKDNCISVEVLNKDKLMKFENTFYIDKENKLYLLESRLFDDGINGGMKGAYLEVFDENGEIVEEYIDDVWEYADWEVFDK